MWSKKSQKERVAIRRVLVVVHQELLGLQRATSEGKPEESKRFPLDRAILITRGAINSLGLGRLEPSEDLEVMP